MPKITPSGFAGLGDASAIRTETRKPVQPEKPASDWEKPKWKADRRAVPLYLTHDAWRQLRRLAFDSERSMNSLLVDGLNRVFEAHGLKTTDDLEQ